MDCQSLKMSTLLVLMMLVAGCATTSTALNVTYLSDPPGAVLYQETQRFGYTPMTLQYPVTNEDQKRGYKLLKGTSVRWMSGASAEISSLRADLNTGLNQQFNFARPDNYPGREDDFRFSLELERNAIMRRQAQAQEDQAFFQMYNAISKPQQIQQPAPLVLPKPRNCTSTVVGNTVRTTCY